MTPCFVTATECVEPPIGVSKKFSAKLRRADDFIRLGVAATAEVLPEPEKNMAADTRTGLFVGTAFGPMQTNFDVLGLIVDEDQTSPTLFSHSVFNSAAGYIARLFNIPGSCFTFTDFSFPFFRALAEGYQAISSGRLDNCVIMQIESYSNLLLDARQGTGVNGDAWIPGAVAWHLSSRATGPNLQITNIDVSCKPSASETLIQRKEQLNIGQETRYCLTPLAAAVSTTRYIQEQKVINHTCTLQAPYGTVSLTLDQMAE